MNLTKYYALLYAMEVGNLSKAAKQMNYTQSNLSRMITSLEGEFGFPLLVREKDGVRPTAEAKRIEPYLRILLRDADNFNEIVHRIKYRATDRLCVACSESFSQCFLPNVMQSMLEKYPQLEYQIIVADHGEIEFLAKQGVIDVAFTSPPYPVIEAQIVELLREPIMAVLPPKHPLAAQEAVEPAQLLQYPYILQESGTDEYITQVLGNTGLTPLKRFRVRGDDCILSMVARGMGVSMVTGMTLRGSSADVVARPLLPGQTRMLSMVIPRQNQRQKRSRIIQDLTAFARAEAQRVNETR